MSLHGIIDGFMGRFKKKRLPDTMNIAFTIDRIARFNVEESKDGPSKINIVNMNTPVSFCSRVIWNFELGDEIYEFHFSSD